MTRRPNYQLPPAHFHLDIFLEARLLQKNLGNAHAAGIADLNQRGLHNYNVITIEYIVKEFTPPYPHPARQTAAAGEFADHLTIAGFYWYSTRAAPSYKPST